MLREFTGLENQLLGRVIQTEKQEMELERTNLVSGIMANRRRMQELERNLLYKLTTVQVIQKLLNSVLPISRFRAFNSRLTGGQL